MKFFNRLISLVLGLALILSFCACSNTISTKKNNIIMVNNEPLDKEYIGYFFYVAKTSMISEAGYTSENSSQEDIKLYWETTEIEGINAVDVARDIAADNAVFQKVQYQKAIEEGITLSQEQILDIESSIENTVSNNGGRDSFDKLLDSMGTNMASYKQIITENMYISELYNLYDAKNILDIQDFELSSFAENHANEIPPEMMLDAAKKEKFNSIAKKWETTAEIYIDDEAMEEFEV